MCGRFVASRPVEEIVEQFAVDEVRLPPELLPGPRFNVAPQDQVLGVRAVVPEGAEAAPGERRLGAYRWGLVPSWAKDLRVGSRAFNARAESLAERPMFRSALERRRLIIPADAFYEWQPSPAAAGRRPGRKRPWCFKAADGRLLGLAGLYALWRQGPESEWVTTCTIITTGANALMAPVHDRMPVVLAPEGYEAWLAPGKLAGGELAHLLSPPPEDLLVAYRVGDEVNSSRAEGPQLAEPLEESSSEPSPSSLPARRRP